MVRMSIFNISIVILWCIFLVVWSVSALSSKENLHSRYGLLGILLRVGAVALIILVARTHLAGILSTNAFFTVDNFAFNVARVALCTFGIGFAIWARLYLGRNWGMPMALKKDAELVTSGPYVYVRHPIYTGILFAMFGSLLTAGFWGLFIFIVVGIYFFYSARSEEQRMLKLFPAQYFAYMQKTKMLIPFLL